MYTGGRGGDKEKVDAAVEDSNCANLYVGRTGWYEAVKVISDEKLKDISN